MNEPIRYRVEGAKMNPDLASVCITFVRDETGDLVKYADYARLQAEVERLRKAGDNLARAADENGCHDNGDAKDLDDSIDRWNAAKEGKQS